jgi:hypothetical protein
MRARFDKQGRPLPETGHGCGCRLCEEANAPRYERRTDAPRGDEEIWTPLQRRVQRLVRAGMLSMRSMHRRGLA